MKIYRDHPYGLKLYHFILPYCLILHNNRVIICDDAFIYEQNHPATVANELRRYFAEYFNSDQGSVDWESKKIFT